MPPFDPNDPYSVPPYEGFSAEERREIIDLPDIQQKLQAGLPVAEQLERIMENVAIASEQIAENMRVAAGLMQQQVGDLRNIEGSARRIADTTNGTQAGMLTRLTGLDRDERRQIRGLLSNPSVENLMALRGVTLGGPLPYLFAAQQGYQRVIDPALNRYLRDPIAAGQITGEGWRAGMDERFDMFRMRLNPFDQIGAQAAQAIVRGTREAGLAPEVRDAFASSIANIVNDLGLDPAQAVQMGVQAYKEAGVSIEAFNAQMEDLDDVARIAGMNVNDLAQTVHDFALQAARVGGPQTYRTARAEIQAGMRQFGFTTSEQMARYSAWRSSIQRQMAGMAGFISADAETPEAIAAASQVIEQKILNWFNGKPQGYDDWAWARRGIEWLGGPGQIFEGLTVEDLMRLYGHIRLGGVGMTGRGRAADEAAAILSEAQAAYERTDRVDNVRFLHQLQNRTDATSMMQDAYIQSLSASLSGTISRGRLETILEPLRTARGDSAAFERAMASTQERVQKILIDLTPDAKAFIRAPQGAINYGFWVGGEGPSYGSVRPPGR